MNTLSRPPISVETGAREFDTPDTETEPAIIIEYRRIVLDIILRLLRVET
jgi:hypothetical protein